MPRHKTKKKLSSNNYKKMKTICVVDKIETDNKYNISLKQITCDILIRVETGIYTRHNEYFDTNTPVKFYWDIDDKTKKYGLGNLQKDIPILAELLQCDIEDFAISSDCRKEKNSFHLICNKYSM